ncbi:MAG TPA: complement resistance protein TraT [Nitrospira sp.]|nr:complement resistance protein TraT [Nitrospira sp.]
MRSHVAFFALLLTATGCSNIVRSGLLNSNSVIMPPGMERTIYVRTGNLSENQQVSLSGITAQLNGKGYHIVTDPTQAHYWLQAHIIYCHKAKQGVTPEQVAQTGFGAGIGSGGTALPSANSFMFAGGGGQMQMPDMNAMMAMAMSMSGMGGMKQPTPEGVLYLCVADVLVTEQAAKGAPAQAVSASESRAATYTMRSVGHVIQKELNIPEATPIIQNKLTTGISGLF